MEAQAKIPPIIDAPRRARGPVTFFGLVLAAIAVAVLVRQMGFAFPKCSLKALIGMPCAFCGGTRSLEALGHLHFAEAFWWNPLVMLGAIGAAMAAVCSLVAPDSMERVVARLKKWPLMWIGLGLVAMNWIFVVKYLPR